MYYDDEARTSSLLSGLVLGVVLGAALAAAVTPKVRHRRPTHLRDSYRRVRDGSDRRLSQILETVIQPAAAALETRRSPDPTRTR